MEKKETRARLLGRLFSSMFVISAFTFGGGYVIVSLMKKKYVDEYGWLSEQEMLDYTALAQSCPGAIAINAAILAGWRVAGAWGMAAAVLGTVLPPLLLLSAISLGYGAIAGNPYVEMVFDGMLAGVAAVLCDVVFSLGRNVLAQRSRVKNAVMTAAFVLVYVFDVSVIYVILGAGALGAFLTLRSGKGAAA